ncbi:aspartic-type endopeptidase [Trichophyton equinum CBS 127.97]|uniref:Aspartic-type endopeptidase n=1 Tax=Trichophyton equinum (strain ATCC MYA-4606 / CBS 127.97) TaxID=559882 RepID=F2Q464_TRIEC|nr:aspartic-type endopeptidase [Trichophyton equinum CBS 127.97]
MGCSLLLTCAYLLVSFSGLVRSACNAPPLFLSIGNGTISDREVVRWGLAVEFGTPSQTIVAALDADWNSTSFWNTSFPCGNLSRPACSWVHGGSFNDKGSTSWREPEDPQQTDKSPTGGTINIRGTDTLKVGSGISLDQFPVYFPKPGVIPQNGIGFGPNSTFLNRLYDQGKIASRSWSLFWGLQGAEQENQMNGSLVLGGYDQAKIAGGIPLKAQFSDGIGCPSSLLVYLSNIVVNHINGNKTSLLTTPGSALRACIKPDNPQVVLPEDVFGNLKKAFPGKAVEHSTGIYPTSLAYEPEDVFMGNITFILSSGLQVTIPNHQLVLPNVEIDDNGQQKLIDGNKTINFGQSRHEAMPYLGQPFLTSAYIHVNNDLKEFSVWQANPTTDTNLITIQSGSNCDDNSSLSGGAIAGIVVGAVAFLAIAALGLFFFLKRRNQNRDRDSKAGLPLVNTSQRAEEDKKDTPLEMDAGVSQQAPSELPSRDYEPQELPADVPTSNK